MIRRKEECNFEIRKAMREGPGEVAVTNFASKEEMLGSSRMFASLHFEPGCGIGMHEHNNEMEIFYVNKGELTYYEDDKEYIIKQGDVAILESGHSHSVINKSNQPADLIAIILLDNQK